MHHSEFFELLLYFQVGQPASNDFEYSCWKHPIAYLNVHILYSVLLPSLFTEMQLEKTVVIDVELFVTILY